MNKMREGDHIVLAKEVFEQKYSGCSVVEGRSYLRFAYEAKVVHVEGNRYYFDLEPMDPFVSAAIDSADDVMRKMVEEGRAEIGYTVADCIKEMIERERRKR